MNFNDPISKVQVLAVSPLESDHNSLLHIFSHTAWSIDSARSLKQAVAKLSINPTAVVLCEESLPDGSWKDLLALTQRLSDPCQLVVTSQHADDRLWAEVLNLGAYDVLSKPFDSREVFRSIGLAWRHCLDARKTVAREFGNRAPMVGVAVA